MSPVSVLVVDDSAVIRRLVTGVLNDDPDISVVGVAANGQIALDQFARLAPNVVTLDIEMPVMDGLTTLRRIRLKNKTVPVIMFSTLTERGGEATLDALAAGATDYVTKPSNTGGFDKAVADVRSELLPKIKGLAANSRRSLAAGQPVARRAATVRPPISEPVSKRPSQPIDVLAVGCSTGGPDALTAVLPKLPATLEVPVLIVQHMPPLFTRLLAQRLDRITALTVREAAHGDPVLPGTVLIAPGGRHMVVQRKGTQIVVALTDDPPENFCRPAVDVLFRSVAEIYGERTLAAVLTGMGRDGEVGSARIRAARGVVYVQDEPTSVVWGMPGAVVAAGQADQILPLDAVADELVRAIAAYRRPSTAGVAL